ncbi:MAG TPA: hypothetical protein VLA24_10490 [Pseudomonadales bacterium]|nr:hypothetical protein [Pseudomonadales bacterium]
MLSYSLRLLFYGEARWNAISAGFVVDGAALGVNIVMQPFA